MEATGGRVPCWAWCDVCRVGVGVGVGVIFRFLCLAALRREPTSLSLLFKKKKKKHARKQAESPSQADMTRFKQLCIQLKNEPFTSGGAAGGMGGKSDA